MNISKSHRQQSNDFILLLYTQLKPVRMNKDDTIGIYIHI